MASLPEAIREQVLQRAKYRCEYCLSRKKIILRLEVDHRTPSPAL